MDTAEIPCALFHLRKTSRAITALYDELLRPSGLRATQYSLLRVVEGLGPIPVSELGAAMGMDRTTATRNVRLLEREGLVRIERGRDRRTRILRLTSRGRSAVAKAHPHWKEAQAIVVAGLGDARWQKLRVELAALMETGRRELGARLRDRPSA